MMIHQRQNASLTAPMPGARQSQKPEDRTIRTIHHTHHTNRWSYNKRPGAPTYWVRHPVQRLRRGSYQCVGLEIDGLGFRGSHVAASETRAKGIARHGLGLAGGLSDYATVFGISNAVEIVLVVVGG